MAFSFRTEPALLLFRRQFALGPTFLADLPDWTRTTLSNGMCLTSHPELAIDHRSSGRAAVTALGMVLDVRQPDASNDQVVARLLAELESCGDLAEFPPKLSALAGRWIIVAELDGAAWLIPDAGGTRQVFHTTPDAATGLPLWCVSQPDLIAPAYGLEMDSAVLEILGSPAYRRNPQYWWPGNRSPYREVRLLMPNHYLDLESATPCRFWPNEERREATLEEAAGACGEILQRTVQAAANRCDLTLPITAGRDSRLTFAACRTVLDRIHFNTFVFHRLCRRDSPDVRIPARMLKDLGLEHQVIECPKRMSKAFAEVYNRNFPNAHAEWGAIAEGFHTSMPDGLVRMTSTLSEIGKCFYGSKGHRGKPINGKNLARMAGLGVSDFVVNAFDEWAEDAARNCGYDPLDVFYWEQRDGSWAAMNFTEWDTVQDVFSPFNCRDLIVAMLSVEEQYRMPPANTLHREILRNLWPELLDYPINPPVPPTAAARARRKALDSGRKITNRTEALLRSIGLWRVAMGILKVTGVRRALSHARFRLFR